MCYLCKGCEESSCILFVYKLVALVRRLVCIMSIICLKLFVKSGLYRNTGNQEVMK